MNVKKVTTLVLVCFFALYSVSFAAVGGGKRSGGAAKKPSAPTQQQQKAPDTEKKAGQGDYKPSKDAKSLDKQAPAANANTNAKSAPAAQPQGSAMGNMMRNIGLFAGGMMLGSMLGSMFGMGEGFFADLLGMLMNGVLLVGIIMAGMMIWRKFKNRNDQSASDRKNDRLLK